MRTKLPKDWQKALTALEKTYGDLSFSEELLVKISGHKKPVTVAIDGRCCAGKTTLASVLAEITGCDVIHMDDFFLPKELRTEERFQTPGGNVHYERVLEEVIPHLQDGREFTYRTFDCKNMTLSGTRTICPSDIHIIEGSYSHHPQLVSHMDVTVFLDADAQTQKSRIENRNGKEMLPVFINRWIPMEELYFTACHTEENAQFVYCTNGNTWYNKSYVRE